MKRVTITKDATKAKRAGLAVSILGFLGSIGSAVSTTLTNEPIYLYTIGAISAAIGIAGIAVAIYASTKDGKAKEVVEIERPNSSKIRIPEKKAEIITNHPDFVACIEGLEASEEIFYITIDKANPDRIVVKSWVEHVNKTIYTLRDSGEIDI